MKLVSGAMALLALVLALVILSGADRRQLDWEVKELQADVAAWRKEVSQAPIDLGLGDPAVWIWVERNKRRQDGLKTLPRDPSSLPLLGEDARKVSDDIKRARKIVVPVPKPRQSFQVHRQLTEQGVSHGGNQKSLASRAAREGIEAHREVLSVVQKQIQSGMAELRAKSKPPSKETELPNGAIVKANYIAALEEALERVTRAIGDEKDRRERERLAELERQRRLAAVQAKKEEEERLREWNSARVVANVVCEDAIRQSLVTSLVRAYARRKNKGDEPVVLEREGVWKFVWREGISRFAVVVAIEEVSEIEPRDSVVLIDLSEDKGEGMLTQIIALDAVVAVVQPTQDLNTISVDDLHKVLRGEVRNWSQLGGEDQEVQLVVPIAGSEDASVVTPELRSLYEAAPQVRYPERGQSVGLAVQGLAGGIGLASFHASSEFKMLSVAPRANLPGISPRPFTISTEDYFYCRRVFAHTTASPDPAVIEFVDYLRGAEGQKAVGRANYVDLRIQIVATPLPSEVMAIIGRVLGTDKILQARRLSTNFRFASDSDRLDLKALADVARVRRILSRSTMGNVHCLVVGFADSQGTADYNQNLSKLRSDAVSSRIERYTEKLPRLIRVGLGEMLPVSDNDTESGREKNRRVELWLVETL